MSNLVRQNNLQQLLSSYRPSFEELAKIHNAVNFRQEASFAWEILQKSDYVMKAAMADQDAFKCAIVNIAGIGLTLNPALGLAYLIPRKGKITYDVSYRGKIALAVEAKSIKSCSPELVYEHDKFKFKGAGKLPLHDCDPFLDDRGALRGGYCVAKTHANEYIISYMSLKQINASKARSESVKANKGSPWETDYEEMVKKTLIRRNSKLWPHASTQAGERLRDVFALEDSNEPPMDPTYPDTARRAEQIRGIKESLITLNIDEDFYVNEKLSDIVRRKIERFEDLTDIELDQTAIQLNQFCQEKK